MSNWELCTLKMNDKHFYEEQPKGQRELIRGWTCDLWIDYIGLTIVTEQLCQDNTFYEDRRKPGYKLLWPRDPWKVSLGLMGISGWDLVSIQHGSNDFGRVAHRSAIAYFKRTIKEGREASDPRLVLPMSPERFYDY